jgi:hypothetical protein
VLAERAHNHDKPYDYRFNASARFWIACIPNIGYYAVDSQPEGELFRLLPLIRRSWPFAFSGACLPLVNDFTIACLADPDFRPTLIASLTWCPTVASDGCH